MVKIRNIAGVILICAGSTIRPTAFAQPTVAQALQPTLPTGWECLQGPNDLDHPGRTFYIDKAGARFELADLKDKVNAVSGTVSSAFASSSGKISAGLLVKFLRLSGLISASGSRNYSTTVALSQRQELDTGEADARSALRTLDPSLIDNSNTYYIIRDTQVAKQIRVVVDRDIAGAFGGEAAFGQIFQLRGAAPSAGNGTSAQAPVLSAQDSHSYTIDQIFGKPLTVCFLAQKFTLRNVTGGVGGSITDARLVDEYWNPSAR